MFIQNQSEVWTHFTVSYDGFGFKLVLQTVSLCVNFFTKLAFKCMF